MSRPGSEGHRPAHRGGELGEVRGMESQDENHQSQVRLHHTHTHTRLPALPAASARKQKFRLGQVLAAQVQDGAAGQVKAGMNRMGCRKGGGG